MPDEYREMIEDAIQDELQASRFYCGMSQTTANPVCASLLATASNDEYRHAQILAAILTGQCPALNEAIQGRVLNPADLEKAVQGELGAICEYATLAKIAPTMQERLLFISIMGDEYGHMRLFTAMQATNCR